MNVDIASGKTGMLIEALWICHAILFLYLALFSWIQVDCFLNPTRALVVSYLGWKFVPLVLASCLLAFFSDNYCSAGTRICGSGQD